MDVKMFVLGDFMTNAFCVRKDHDARQCVIIDPGLDADPMLDFVKENHLTPEIILLTHGHADHIDGIGSFKSVFPDIQTAIHEGDAAMLDDAMLNLSAMFGMQIQHGRPDMFIEDNETIDYAGLSFRTIHTPGHSPGGCCFYCREEGILFSGDTLFSGSIGRTDFPGGSHQQLIQSIRSRLFDLPDETVVYCGHGPETTLEQEKMNNPYLK
jgi:glyoxylase-like metal-dependent hydrolase (beta-lactamase superfamily II)